MVGEAFDHLSLIRHCDWVMQRADLWCVCILLVVVVIFVVNTASPDRLLILIGSDAADVNGSEGERFRRRQTLSFGSVSLAWFFSPAEPQHTDSKLNTRVTRPEP